MIDRKTIPAIITATLAASSVASPYYYNVNITQRLCKKACADDKPLFRPEFSVTGIDSVGTNQYLITVHIEGTIHYVPCHCGSCDTHAQIISQDIAIPVFSATPITAASIIAGVTLNGIARNSCCECSNIFVSDTPIALTIVNA